MDLKLFGLWVMGLLYILAGLNHFRSPEMYMKLMPPYLPAHRALVLLSGIAEIVLGALLLWPPTTQIAAWGIIVLLIALFPANLYMYRVRKTVFRSLPSWALALRLPLQGLLILWAYYYTKA